eukprot:scaffold3511_cov92-Cylindrotheca_fusiformis.AAC.4
MHAYPFCGKCSALQVQEANDSDWHAWMARIQNTCESNRANHLVTYGLGRLEVVFRWVLPRPESKLEAVLCKIGIGKSKASFKSYKRWPTGFRTFTR